MLSNNTGSKAQKIAKEKVKARKEIRNRIRELLYLDEDASELDVLEEIVRLKEQLDIAESRNNQITIDPPKQPWTIPTIEPWIKPFDPNGPYIAYNTDNSNG